MNRLVLASWLCLCPIAIEAQNTWSFLPNGELGYTTTYTTVGTFRCDPLNNGILGGTCSASGNALRLTAGSAVLDVIYHPVTAQITASNTVALAPLGWFETDFSGTGPFSFPRNLHGFQSMLFDFTLSGPGTIQFGYMNIPGGTNRLRRNCCSSYVNTITQKTTTPPAPYTYTDVAYYNFTYPVIAAEDDSLTFVADVSLIPEPTSLLLVGTGLLGMAAIGRARRRRGD